MADLAARVRPFRAVPNSEQPEKRASLAPTRLRIESGVSTVAQPERADSEQRGAILRAAKTSFDRADEQDTAGFDRWDAGFHTAVAESTGNRLLAKAVTDSMVLTFALRPAGGTAPGDSVHCAEQHIEVAEAVRAGEGDLASRLMADHIGTAMAVALAATGSKSGQPEAT